MVPKETYLAVNTTLVGLYWAGARATGVTGARARVELNVTSEKNEAGDEKRRRLPWPERA